MTGKIRLFTMKMKHVRNILLYIPKDILISLIKDVRKIKEYYMILKFFCLTDYSVDGVALYVCERLDLELVWDEMWELIILLLLFLSRR